MHVTYSYADTCRNIFNTIKTSGLTSLEKYTSHFIETVECESELETEQRLQHIQHIDPPQLFLLSQPFFPLSWPAQPVGGSLCWDMVLIPASSLQLIWTSCRRDYIIIWHPPTFERHICTQYNPSTVKAIPWYLRTDAPVSYTCAFPIWQPGWVGGQYAIYIYIYIYI